MQIEAEAYSQVSYIISKMSENLRSKIPQDFINMIEKNKDKEYKISVAKIDDMKLLTDTEKILSVIYTDYIASEEERKIIKNKEKMIYLKQEEKKRKQYTTELFEKRKDRTKNEEIQEMAIATQTKEKWYQKIINRIKRILKRCKYNV